MRWFPGRKKRAQVLPERRRVRSGTHTIEKLGSKVDPIRKELETLAGELVAAGYLTEEEAAGSLVAAGQHVLNGQATLLRRLIQPWQIRAFGYYDLLGEIKYAAQFYSRSLSNLRLYMAKIDDAGETYELGVARKVDGETVEPELSADDKTAIDALKAIKDPGGAGRSGLLASYGRLMFLTGETYLFCSVNPETELEQWEMLSTDEIRLNDGLYTRFKSPSLPATQFRPAPNDQFRLVGVHPKASDEQRAQALDIANSSGGVTDEAVAYRLWRRHPRFSDLADSTMQGVLELCEELVLLTQAVRARARSRLAGSGVLFLDARITTKPLDANAPDEDALEDPFVADLTTAMTSPIVDEGTAAAVVPLVARVEVPDGMRLQDLVYHLQIVDPMQIYPETGLRTECIHRIAIGLDMPSDILEGVTDANHWTAWMVDEQSWKAHLQPVAQQLVEDLTSAYIGPYLKQEGVEDWSSYIVGYDAAAVINHPDRTKDALDGHDRGVVNDETLRETLGFDDSAALSEQERNRWLGVKLRDSYLAVYGEPSLRSNSEIAPTEGTLVGPDGVVQSPDQAADANSAADVEAGPPPSGPPDANGNGGPPPNVIGSAVFVARVEGAAFTALLRAREAAGARLRSLARSDESTSAAIDGIPNHRVAARLGAPLVRQILRGQNETTLVASAGILIDDALKMVGLDDDPVREAIAENVSALALRTLYDERPVLPVTFPEFVLGLVSGRNGH